MTDRTILYVEDNVHNRRIVRKILSGRGYHVIEAEDGLTGYEMIRDLKPPLVLLNIALPHLDGIQIAKLVKADEQLRHIPLIALTASAMRGDRERFLAAGCDDYRSKPLRAPDLVALVDSYFEDGEEEQTPTSNEQSLFHQDQTDPEEVLEKDSSEARKNPYTSIVAPQNGEGIKDEFAFLRSAKNLEHIFPVETLPPFEPDLKSLRKINYEQLDSEKEANTSSAVLIIDENPQDARLLRRILQVQLGVEVFVAPTVEKGAAFLTNCSPQLIVIGVNGSSSFNAINSILMKKSKIPMLLLLSKEAETPIYKEFEPGCLILGSKESLHPMALVQKMHIYLLNKQLHSKVVNSQAFNIPVANSENKGNAMPTVLVIEDIPDSANLARKILVKHNLDVLVAENGAEGLAMALENSPDLILLDLGLPDMDGQTLVGLLRAENKLQGTPIIACTAWPEETARRMAETYGFDDYISKPYQVTPFMDIVKKNIPADTL